MVLRVRDAHTRWPLIPDEASGTFPENRNEVTHERVVVFPVDGRCQLTSERMGNVQHLRTAFVCQDKCSWPKAFNRVQLGVLKKRRAMEGQYGWTHSPSGHIIAGAYYLNTMLVCESLQRVAVPEVDLFVQQWSAYGKLDQSEPFDKR
jgi:hypothetical protein